MTEPVAYLNKYLDNSTNITRYKPENQHLLSSNPLYTAEQLHPRVKMTKDEFEEWKDLYYHLIEYSLSVHKMLDEILESFGVRRGKYVELSKRVYQNNGFMNVSKKQAELVDLFVNYNPDKKEEMIEIVPNMKWFVRSKKTDDDGWYAWLMDTDIEEDIINQLELSEKKPDGAYSFDTKEEAEKWTNPLTEAALLPIDE